MTNSDSPEARRLLQVIVAALDPAAVKNVIDAPIETAAEKLLCGMPQPSLCEQFNSRMCEFVSRIYMEASLSKRVLSREEAFAVGVQILNDGYGARGRMGYEHALLDVLQDCSQEMDVVLRAIMEGIKAREQHDYAQWVYARHVEPLGWPMKCALAEAICKAHTTEDGKHLLKGTPARFAAHLSDLVSAHLATVQSAQN
jgi:hypothetical protein